MCYQAIVLLNGEHEGVRSAKDNPQSFQRRLSGLQLVSLLLELDYPPSKLHVYICDDGRLKSDFKQVDGGTHHWPTAKLNAGAIELLLARRRVGQMLASNTGLMPPAARRDALRVTTWIARELYPCVRFFVHEPAQERRLGEGR